MSLRISLLPSTNWSLTMPTVRNSVRKTRKCSTGNAATLTAFQASVGTPSAARAKSNRSASRGSRMGFDDSWRTTSLATTGRACKRRRKWVQPAQARQGAGSWPAGVTRPFKPKEESPPLTCGIAPQDNGGALRFDASNKIARCVSVSLAGELIGIILSVLAALSPSPPRAPNRRRAGRGRRIRRSFHRRVTPRRLSAHEHVTLTELRPDPGIGK